MVLHRMWGEDRMKAMSYGKVVEAFGQRMDKLVAVSYEYHKSDPLIVDVTFYETDHDTGVVHVIPWQISRELFATALKSGWAGGADVTLEDGDRKVAMKLETDEFKTVIELNRSHLEEFIEKTDSVIPIGREPMDDIIDALVKEIFEA